MKLYLKGDYTKRVPMVIQNQLVKWVSEDEHNSLTQMLGNNDALQEDFFPNLSLRKGTGGQRWSSVP